MRKIPLASGAVLLALSGLAGTAGAQSTSERPAFVQWQSPDEGARLAGQSVHIKAKVGVYGGVKGWAVEAVAPEGADYPGYGTLCEKVEGGSPASVNIDCVWDTTGYPDDGGSAQNRPYVVRISAHGSRSGSTFSSTPHQEQRNVTVSNPVSAPRDVRLGWVDNTRQATIRWQPNPEPDIASYVVQERLGDGPWKNVGQAGGKVTTFTRDLSAPGTYRYQVAALRSAGSGTDTIQSAWAGPAAEPKQVVVPEPKRPETTTTTTPPYSADGAGAPGDSGPPADPAVPSPGAAPGAANDPATGSPPPGSAAGQGGLLSPIQPGSPGSVKSGGATVGGTGPGRPAQPGQLPDEPETEEPDTGFSSELPYKQSGETAEDGDVGRMLVALPEAIGGDETRQVLVPLAAGLLLFVFAMHALYLARRAAPEAPLDTE